MLDIESSIEARKIIRENKYTEQTAGTAAKFVQGNVCILPSKYALDFASFCHYLISLRRLQVTIRST